MILFSKCRARLIPYSEVLWPRQDRHLGADHCKAYTRHHNQRQNIPIRKRRLFHENPFQFQNLPPQQSRETRAERKVHSANIARYSQSDRGRAAAMIREIRRTHNFGERNCSADICPRDVA